MVCRLAEYDVLVVGLGLAVLDARRGTNSQRRDRPRELRILLVDVGQLSCLPQQLFILLQNLRHGLVEFHRLTIVHIDYRCLDRPLLVFLLRLLRSGMAMGGRPLRWLNRCQCRRCLRQANQQELVIQVVVQLDGRLAGVRLAGG